MEVGQSSNVGRKRDKAWLLELSTLTLILFLEARGQSIRNLVYGERGFLGNCLLKMTGGGVDVPTGRLYRSGKWNSVS